MSETVKAALALRDGQLKDKTWEMRGSSRKKWKYLRREGGHQRQTLYTQQAKILEVNRGDSAAHCGQAGGQTFSHIFHIATQHHHSHLLLPFQKKRHSLCCLPCFSVGETPSCGKGCDGDAAGLWCQPSRTGDVPLGEPSAGNADTQVSWQRCGVPQHVMLMSGHPSWVLEEQRFRHPHCFKMDSE